MGNRSAADAPPAGPNPLETERFAGSEISPSISINVTENVPGSKLSSDSHLHLQARGELR